MEKTPRVQKNLRLPSDIIQQIQALSDERDYSFNKVAIDLLRLALVTTQQEPLRPVKGDDEMTIRTDAEGKIQ